jgi:hypothetical protein
MKKIFFAYSDNAKDVELYKEFSKHFITYARKGMIFIIDKDELFRVDNDNSHIYKYLDESDITVPLLSVDYLVSDQCIKLLETAAAGNKTIIPVLLRDCDFTGIDKMKELENNMLPDDKQSVAEHIIKEGGQDEVFSEMAKKVKAIIFKELESVKIVTGSRLFYYILAGIVLLIGGLGAVFSYLQWNDLIIASIVFLMFVVIAFYALKNVLFPTKFKIG